MTNGQAITTISELYRQLEIHDWHYCMSDDGQIFRNGAAKAARLVLEAAKIEGGADLLVAYQQHVFSGPPWSQEKKPKPERPKP